MESLRVKEELIFVNIFILKSWRKKVKHSQTMSIERVRRSNQSNAIERDRTVEIRLSNAIESQSNGQILGNYSIGSIEIRLRSIEILRSI